MRDIPLLLVFFGACLWVPKYPVVGVMLWAWTALIVPNSYVYGLAVTIPFNKISAVLTLISLMISREPKYITLRSTMGLLFIFGIWGTISALLSTSAPENVMVELEKFIKIIIFSFAAVAVINTKERINAVLFATVLSLGFHGVLSGAKYILSGGGHHVYGPTGGSIISDNNHFALAMIALLPIVFYLYKQSSSRFIRSALIGSSVLIAFAIIGTASRGGLIGISAIGLAALVRSRQKFKYIMVMFPLVAAATIFAPDTWYSRMDTIKTAGEDNSFMGRVIAWKQSTLIAMDHPWFGGGFYAVQDFEVWTKYARMFNDLDFIRTPYPDPYGAHAAHSIYFQVLGDMGFVGLALFLTILVTSWRNASAIINSSGSNIELAWARDLALAFQYSLLAYMITGAALNMAYFDYAYIIFALLVVLRRLVNNISPSNYKI